MGTPEDAQTRARNTYNAASDTYDEEALSFWSRFGSATIARLNLEPGSQVLDACCGSGASAIPAAERVGPQGRVIGVDLAADLLALARAKAAARGIGNLEFRSGDILDLDLPDAGFDAVVCVFGIFFVPDMPAAVRALWRRVRPGGTLAITTWGARLFEPANTIFWDAVRALRPDLYKGFNPWDRIVEPAALAAMLAEGGVNTRDVIAESATHPLRTPDDWWAIVMGSGYRGTIEQLTPADRERVRESNLARIGRDDIRAVETNVVYARAVKD